MTPELIINWSLAALAVTMVVALVASVGLLVRMLFSE